MKSYHHKNTQHRWNILHDSENRVTQDDEDDMWNQLYKSQSYTRNFLFPAITIIPWSLINNTFSVILASTHYISWPTDNAVLTNLMTYNWESVTLISTLLLNSQWHSMELNACYHLPPIVTKHYNLRRACKFHVITKTHRTSKSFIKYHSSKSYV